MGARLAGEIAVWPSKEGMADILRAAGLEVTVGRYSVRVEGHSRFTFQEYGGDLGDPIIDADAAGVAELLATARLVSDALVRAGVVHRFEVYDEDDELVGYLHHGWPLPEGQSPRHAEPGAAADRPREGSQRAAQRLPSREPAAELNVRPQRCWMPQLSMIDCWSRVERWLSRHAPDILPLLPPGTNADAIAEAESRLGLALPDDLKEFVSVHDGGGGLWLHDLGVPLSLSGSIEVWDREVGLWGNGNNDEWASPEGPIRKKWFSPGWIPFLDTWCGDCYCIDLDPPEEARRGQLISWYHNNGPTDVVAPSLAVLVRTWAEEVEGGLYVPRLHPQGQPYLERRQT